MAVRAAGRIPMLRTITAVSLPTFQTLFSDLIFIIAMIVFFLVSLAYVRVCERLK